MKSKTAFIVLFLLFALFAGCKTSGLSESTDPLVAVSGAFNKLKTVQYYKKNETKKQGTTIERYRESPDRYWQHLKTPERDMEVFMLGEYAYGRTNEKPWVKQKIDRNADASSGETQRSIDELDLEQVSEIKFDSKTNLNGMKAFIYTCKKPIIPEKPSLGMTIERIWINAETGLPLKIESGINIAEPSTITTFDYEKKVDLKPPIPE